MVRRSTRKRNRAAEVTLAPNKVQTKKVKKEVEPTKKKKQNDQGHAKEHVVAKIKGVEKKTKSKKLKSDLGSGTRPTQEESMYATMALSALHPYVVDRNNEHRKTLLESCGMRDSITDAVVSTMLSQNTTDANSKAAFKSLKSKFDTWEDVVECDDISKIEDAIRVAGLAKTRSERIQTMLRTVKQERGVASLDYIRELNDEETKVELSRFKGLGPKTISCVLLFALGRPEFPVDTHVLRITQKMGWVPSSASREGAYEYLNEMIPNDIKMDLHCLLVRHGKCCHKCASNGRPQFPPEDGSKLNCPLVNVSKWSGTVPNSIVEQTKKTYDSLLVKPEECESAVLGSVKIEPEIIKQESSPIGEDTTIHMEPDEIKSEMI